MLEDETKLQNSLQDTTQSLILWCSYEKDVYKKIEIWKNENTKEDEEKERQGMEMNKRRETVFCAKLYMADLQAAFSPMSCNTSLTSASISPSSVAPNGMATR